MRIKSRFIVLCFLVLCGLLISRIGHADDFWNTKSSNTATIDTTKYIPNARAGDMLGALVINKRSALAETIAIYDSSASATSLIGTVDLSTGVTAGAGYPAPSEIIYNLRISSGITYTTSGAGGTADITILWKSMRAN